MRCILFVHELDLFFAEQISLKQKTAYEECPGNPVVNWNNGIGYKTIIDHFTVSEYWMISGVDREGGGEAQSFTITFSLQIEINEAQIKKR